MAFNLFASDKNLSSEEFTASGTFNVPAGVTLVWITGCGAGGGGGAGYSNSVGHGGGGGGAGEHAIRHPVHVTPSAAISVTIGAGGAGGVATGSTSTTTSGGDGGDTLFGTLARLQGGGGGQRGTDSDGDSYNGEGGGVGGGYTLQSDATTDENIPWANITGTETIVGGAAGQRVNSNYPDSPNYWGYMGGEYGPGTLRTSIDDGGAGAGSLYANGGDGGDGSTGSGAGAGTDGGTGAGGGGGGVYTYLGSYTGYNGGDGGDGYLLVEYFTP